MFALKRLLGGCVFVSTLVTTSALAQVVPASVGIERESVTAVAPLVTAAASARRVRFVSPGTVVQLRLEIYNEAGQKLFDTELHGGNVLDWHLQDGAGQRLPAGAYACVLTIKSLSGRLSQRVGVVTVNDEKAAVETGGAALSLAQQQTIGPVEANAAFTIVQESEAEAITAVTHDGTEGQLGRTRGALSFRLGDVFSGKDKEQMRLTEDGSLGLGTSEPKAKLDVAGTIRAERVLIARPKSGNGQEIAAGDTSLAPEAAEIDQPLVAGTGTQNKITKWTDGAGTLGDSVITELGGNLGIGTATPASLLHLAGPGGVSGITLNTPGTHRFRFQTLPGIVNWGALTLNANYNFPSGWVLDEAATNGWFFKLDNRGGNNSGPLSGLWLYRVPPGAGAHTDEVPMFGVSSAHAFFAGKVGIGTNQPTFKLHLVDSSNAGLRVETGTPGGILASFGGLGDFQIDAHGVVGGRFAVKEGGRVGIGTNTPLAALDLKGGADSDGAFDPSAMAFQYRDGGYRHWIRTRHNAILGSGNAIDFFVNDSSTPEGSSGAGLGSGSAFVMTLDSGRVGIGTFDPTEKLTVEGRIQSTSGGFKFPDGTVQTTAIANAAYYTKFKTEVIQVAGWGPGTYFESVIHLNLPLGTYLLTATIEFNNRANFLNGNNYRMALCGFSGQSGAEYRNFSLLADSYLTTSIHSVLNISSGGVDLVCQATYDNPTNIFTGPVRLTAVKLENVVVQ